MLSPYLPPGGWLRGEGAPGGLPVCGVCGTDCNPRAPCPGGSPQLVSVALGGRRTPPGTPEERSPAQRHQHHLVPNRKPGGRGPAGDPGAHSRPSATARRPDRARPRIFSVTDMEYGSCKIPAAGAIRLSNCTRNARREGFRGLFGEGLLSARLSGGCMCLDPSSQVTSHLKSAPHPRPSTQRWRVREPQRAWFSESSWRD